MDASGLISAVPKKTLRGEGAVHIDMVFRDDECRVRTNNAPANFAACCDIAYNLTRKAPGEAQHLLHSQMLALMLQLLTSPQSPIQHSSVPSN
jgi:hypothetical protein